MNGGRDDFVHDSPSYQLKEVAEARVNHPQFTIWLVVLTILKNMKVNWKDDIPYIMENKKGLKPPTSHKWADHIIPLQASCCFRFINILQDQLNYSNITPYDTPIGSYGCLIILINTNNCFIPYIPYSIYHTLFTNIRVPTIAVLSHFCGWTSPSKAHLRTSAGARSFHLAGHGETSRERCGTRNSSLNISVVGEIQ